MKNKKSKKNKRIIPKQKGGVSKEDGEIIFGIFIWALGLYCLFYIARCRCLNCCIESGVRVAVTDSVHDVERGSPSPPPSQGSAGMSANRRNESMIAFANNLQSETRENLQSANRRTDSMIAFADNLRSEPGVDLRSATDEANNDDTIMLPVAKEILKVIAQPLPSADETLDTVIATEMLWLVHSANTPENLLKEINNIMPAAIIIRGLTDSVDAQLSHIRNQITSQNQHETRRTGGGKALSSETRPPSLAAAAARAHTRSPFLSSFFRAATRPRRFRRTAAPAAEKKAIMTMMDHDIDYYIDYYIDMIITVSDNNTEKFLKNINGFIKKIVLILMRQRRYMVPDDAKEILPEIAKEILEDKMKNYGMKTTPSVGGKKTRKKRKKSCKKTRRKSSKQRHRKKRRTRR